MDFAVYLSALGIASGLIVGIGPQNAFVIRQGIGRRHVLPIVLTCIGCEVFFITLGVWGFGSWIASQSWLMNWMVWFGAAFIGWMGYRSLVSAFQPKQLDSSQGGVETNLAKAVKGILGVSFLNPYLWMDVALIGGLSSAYGTGNKLAFLLGCLTAAVVWFFGIGFGAGKMAPLFASSKSWRVLDGTIAGVMFVTAGMLVVRFGLH